MSLPITMCQVQRKSIWVVAAIKAKFGWPTSQLSIPYCGREFLLRPETNEYAPSVCIKDESGLTLKEGNDLINRLLSALAWAHGAGIHVEWVVGSNGNKPIKVGKSSLRYVAEPWHSIYLPQPTEEKSLRALAVFREALALNNPAYRFLGLFKILNIRFASGLEQKNWINNSLVALKDSQSIERIQQLAGETDIGAYLYHQGRCAVAHAFTSDVVDPDISEESQRLENDFHLMKELAELLISQEFGIPTDSEFWQSLRYSHETSIACVMPTIEESDYS